MLDDFRSSLNNVFKERIASPFYGAFIFSCCVWNWKIIYLTIFVSEDKIQGTKLDFILNHLLDLKHAFWLPLISAAVLLTILPFVTNGFYWLGTLFDKWKLDVTNKILKNQLLTPEQGNILRNEMKISNDRLQGLLIDKDATIDILRKENTILRGNTLGAEKQEQLRDEEWELAESKMFFDDANNKFAFKQLSTYIQNKEPIPESFNSIIKILLDASVIKENNNRIFQWTEKGRSYLKIAVRQKLF